MKGNTLIVYDKEHRTLWTHPFESPLNESYYREPGLGVYSVSPVAVFDDIDGDGDTELLFVMRSAAAESQVPRYTLFCFDRQGHVRWEYQPGHTVRFGSDVYEPPFFVVSMIAPRHQPGHEGTIWVASHHNSWFPAVVAKLDVRGKILAEYWHAGTVVTLAEADLGGRHVMLAGGTNNGEFNAALSVLDYDNPQGSSPAAADRYRCQSCPAGSPLQYILFPRSELSRVLDIRPIANRIWVRENGEVEIGLIDGSEAGRSLGGAAFFFNPQFRLLGAEVTDSYVSLHHELEARGALKHTVERKRESEALRAIRYWDGKQFTTTWVPPR